MKLNAMFEEMEVVLNELNEQFETIKVNEARVPQIEIDIIMASTRKLYEYMSQLNKQEKTLFGKQISPSVEEVKEDLLISQTDNTVLEDADTKIDDEIEVNIAVIVEDESYENVTNSFLEEIDNIEEAKSELKETDTKKVLQKDEKPKSSLLLQFEDEMFSVNESVAQKIEDKSLVNKLSNKRIESLKSAIGINDKFYFINELFSGDSQAYEDVIYTLNNFKRFEEAMQYVSTLKYRYDWDVEIEAYQKLVHFLERKFVEVHA